MVKANIGEVEITEKTILSGNDHLVVPYPVKDGLTNLKAGAAVKITDGKIEHVAADTDDAIGVLYKSVDLEDGKKTLIAVLLYTAPYYKCLCRFPSHVLVSK